MNGFVWRTGALSLLLLAMGCGTNALGDGGSDSGGPCDDRGVEEVCGSDTGACQAGARTCRDDFTWSGCEGERGPQDETCDGFDNDCDGDIDEELTAPADTCLTAGVCGDSEPTCSDGAWDCDYPVDYEPNAEATCDTLDNDCDGEVDEGLPTPSGLDLCPTLYEGVCAGGLQIGCVAGEWDCDFPTTFEDTESTCDGLDNDCNGQVDEGLVTSDDLCPNRFGGVCGEGLVSGCVNGAWGCDFPAAYEETETICDGLDNDCDGAIDEDVVVTTDDCPSAGICFPGLTAVCLGGLQCDFPAGYEDPEVTCDDLDNDCDGQIDEEIFRSPLGFCLTAGVCAAAVAQCTAGDWYCSYPAEYEIGDETLCDGLDNDCDFQVDEGVTQAPVGTCNTLGVCAYVTATCQAGSWSCAYPADYEASAEVSCDGLDNDCDGVVDDGLLNRCGECAPPDNLLVEVCVNGLDDDCDGEIDEGCACDPDCHCDDPDAGTFCTCNPPTGQTCYSGQPNTLGFGPCRGGLHDCVEQADGSFLWSNCAGEQLPALECDAGVADGVDNDCDGMVDEDCLPDGDGDGIAPPLDCDDSNIAVFPGAAEACNGIDDNCNGTADEGVTNICGACGAVPTEVCGDGLDNDCDGEVEEDCGGACNAGDTRPCYTGPPSTVGQGQCAWGVQSCYQGTWLTSCNGDVRPDLEICDGADNDCDTVVDERWSVGSNICGWCNGTEICDGIDNDCDGITDEGMRNSCGDCLPGPPELVCDGLDDNCNGQIDEGLYTACGTCPQVACYSETWDEPSDCVQDQRDCQGVETDPNDPNAVTLGQGSVNTPFIYIAVNGIDQVAKLDTESGAKIWQVASHGDDPSRTAVALDYSVWVANRGSGSIWDPDFSNAVHLDADGNLICRADTPGRARGIAIDGNGHVWVGTWEGQTVYELHGTNTNSVDCATPPCCEVVSATNIAVSVYGLAVDGNGYLWTSSGNSHSHTVDNGVRLDTITGTFEYFSNPSWYGIAVSPVDGRVWYGNYWTSAVNAPAACVHSVEPVSPYSVMTTDLCGGTITAVTVDFEGYVWASSYSQNRLYKLDPGTGEILCDIPVPMVGPGATDARGVAMDAAGMVWVSNRLGGYANRFFRDCTHDATFEVSHGNSCYTYSDMTGMQLQTVTTREAHWIQNFDSGYSTPIWHSATWTAITPPGTAVDVTFTGADTEAELTTNPSAPCGPYGATPADLLSCPDVQGFRWLAADVQLSTTQDGVRPSFSNLQVNWSR